MELTYKLRSKKLKESPGYYEVFLDWLGPDGEWYQAAFDMVLKENVKDAKAYLLEVFPLLYQAKSSSANEP